MNEKEYMTFEEASEYIGLNRTTLYKYVKKLGITTYKFRLDRRTYLAIADVERIKEVKEKPWLAGLDENEMIDEAVQPALVA